MPSGMNNLYIFIKLLIIFVLLLIFYKLYRKESLIKRVNASVIEPVIEDFENINYAKLNETYFESDKTKLDLLYTNYDGDDLGKDIWENKTLEQCYDVCNELDNCVGFSRDLVNDDANGSCYPRTQIANFILIVKVIHHKCKMLLNLIHILKLIHRLTNRLIKY